MSRYGGNLGLLALLNKDSLLISHCLKRLTWSFQFPLDFNPVYAWWEPSFQVIPKCRSVPLGNYKSDDNFSQAPPRGSYWWLRHVTLVRPLLLNSFAVSCPCADPRLATHWILILFICIQLSLCCPIGSSKQVTPQRTSWFLISWSWCMCSCFVPLLFINKCKQIKCCLGDLWHMFKLVQREARLPQSFFHVQLATSSSVGVHFIVIVLEPCYLSQVEVSWWIYI